MNSSNHALSAIHFEVIGRVQGVYFRASTQTKALSLGLTGWVQNTEDGRVEGEACGEQKALDDFCEWLNIGPKAAQVKYLEVNPIPTESWSGFEII